MPQERFYGIAHGADTKTLVDKAIESGFSIAEVNLVVAWRHSIPHLPFQKNEVEATVQHQGVKGVVLGIGHKLNQLGLDRVGIVMYDANHTEITHNAVDVISRSIGSGYVWVCGPDLAAVSAICARDPQNRRPVYTLQKPWHIERFREQRGKLLPPFGLSVQHRLINGRFMDEFGDGGIEILAYTPDEQAEIEALIRLGVNGIATNRYQEFKRNFSPQQIPAFTAA